MPTTRLETTIAALKPGFKEMDPKAAINNIEGWETYLETQARRRKGGER